LKPRRVQIIAHQGASGHAPENTLAAFEEAIAQGTDWIELDVQRVEDELFVIHDYRLDRITDMSGALNTVPLATIRQARIAGRYPIATLREALALINRRCRVNIEIKSPATALPVINLVEELIARGGWSYSDFMLSSFNQYELLTAHRIQPQLATGVIIYGLPYGLAEFARPLGVGALVECIEFISPELVENAHAAGLEVLVYTVNYPDDIERMADLGVEGLVTNYPARAKKIVSKGGSK